MAAGDIIYGSDYNAVQVKISGILGDGSFYGYGSYGYNQGLQSSLVAVRQPITSQQWQYLANDVNKAYLHQNNTNFPSFPTISGLVSYSNLTLIDGIVSPMVATNATRSTAASAQKTKVQQSSGSGVVNLTNTRNSAWGGGNSAITGAFRIDFGSAATAQYFFNQGGSVQIEGFGPNLSGSVQDADWNTFLSTYRFSMDYTGFAGLTGSNATIQTLTDTASSSGKYNANTIVTQAYTTGGSIYFTIIYTDAHVATGAGPDTVSAGTGYYVYITSATGAFTGYTINGTSGTTTSF